MTSVGGPPRHGAFISYARADGELAARDIHARLRTQAPEIPTWLDRFEIEGGVGWWTQIERELDRAEFLILVMTPAALRSENTRNEWRSARQRGVCVYPVKGAADGELDFGSLPNWMRKAHFYDADVEWEKLVAHLRRGCRATRVPFMAPPLPPTFVRRQREIETVIDVLLAGVRGGASAATALRGPGGFGKTTLATAIAHDDRVLDAFDDGILWTTLGPTPNLLNEIVKVYAALTGTRPGFVDVDDACRELALTLEHKNCLLVIDDTWSVAHLRPFMRGGAGCARLVTTRSLDVTAGVSRVDVERMTAAEAVQLLAAHAGLPAARDAALRQLVARLGEWPLAIRLAGSAMRRRIERGDTVRNALDYLSRALEKRGITAFDAERASDREDAVARTVGASFELLPPDAQQRCGELAVFPEAAAIPIRSAATLWKLDELDAEDLARTLDDLGLVEFDLGRGALRIHAVLRGFFAARVPDAAAVHARLLDAWPDVYALPDAHAWRHFPFHMRGAGRSHLLRELLLDFRWLEAKLRATDVHSLIADFEDADSDPVLAIVRDALKLGAPSVASDPRQLRAQLVARTQSRAEPEIAALRDTARRLAGEPWLDLLHPTVDAPGGVLVTTLVGHSREVLALAADADHCWIVSGSSDETIRQWDMRGGHVARVLERPRRVLGVRAVAVTADGRMALAGGADGLISVWDLERGQLVDHFSREAGRAITGVAVSADGTVALSASRDPVLRVWDVASHTVLRVLAGHEEDVTCVAVSADGTRAVSGSHDATVRVWSVAAGTLERTLAGHAGAVNAVALSADGRHALSGSSDATVRVWALETGACLHTLHHDASVTAVALAPLAWKAISGASDGSIRVWDLRDGAVVAQLRGHSDRVTAITVDPACTRATSASVDRTIKLWRPAQLGPEIVHDAHAGAVLSLVFSDDGRLCASGGEDGRIKVRDVASGQVVREIEAHGGAARTLAFSIDRACVLSAGDDLGHWLWTIESGEGTWIPVRHTAPIDSYALSPSARYLITSCGDRFVYRWDVPSGAIVDRYGTRRLFDHLIEAAPRRGQLEDTDYWDDRYLDGEAIYEVVVVRTSRDGAWAVLSAMRRERSAIRDASLRSGLRADAGRAEACVAVVNLSSRDVWSVDVSQSDPLSAFAVDDRGEQLLFARADHAIELWARDADEPSRVLRGHTDKVNAIAIADGCRRAASCGRDRTVRVWDLETGNELAGFTVDAAVRALAFAPDGRLVAAGDVAGRTHLFRLVEP
jgi:WD40 repeat protein